MATTSRLLSQLARQLTGAGNLLAIVAFLLVPVMYVVAAVVVADLLAPAPEPIIAAPLRW